MNEGQPTAIAREHTKGSAMQRLVEGILQFQKDIFTSQRLENLRTHPSVAAALARDELKLHGWVYKFETGQVFGYDSRRGQYDVVGQGPARQHESRLRHQ